MRAIVITVVGEDEEIGEAIYAAISKSGNRSAIVRALTPREVEENQAALRALYDDAGYRSVLREVSESVRQAD